MYNNSFRNKNVPCDYGKYIQCPELQNHFRQFLMKENKKYNREMDIKYWCMSDDESDMSKKIGILEKGADLGGAACSRELANYYNVGQGVTQNKIKAEKYIRYSAECGIPEGMFILSAIYGNKDDRKLFLEGIDWLCKAAIKGSETWDFFISQVCVVFRTMRKQENIGMREKEKAMKVVKLIKDTF